MFDLITLEQKKQEINKDLANLQPQIVALTIKDQDDLAKASEFASMAQARVKKIDELRTTFKKPALDWWRAVDSWAKMLSAPYETLLTGLKGKMKD